MNKIEQRSLGEGSYNCAWDGLRTRVTHHQMSSRFSAQVSKGGLRLQTPQVKDFDCQSSRVRGFSVEAPNLWNIPPKRWGGFPTLLAFQKGSAIILRATSVGLVNTLKSLLLEFWILAIFASSYVCTPLMLWCFNCPLFHYVLIVHHPESLCEGDGQFLNLIYK